MMRQATIDDLPKICEMAFKFIRCTEWINIYTPERVMAYVERHIVDEDKLAIYEEDKGILLAVKGPFLFGEVLVATEMGWWVEPQYRGTRVGSDLFNAFETWAKEQGCVRIQVGCLDPEVYSFYKRRGYNPRSQQFEREI